MGVLEYGPTFLQLNLARDRILRALAPGGYLLLQSWHGSSRVRKTVVGARRSGTARGRCTIAL